MTNTRKILIVDDDSELCEALVEQLALHEEFESIAVENGTKGVQAAKAGQIDLVIMDVGLPDVDGREAVRILRKKGFKAPIIMLTGHKTIKTRRHLLISPWRSIHSSRAWCLTSIHSDPDHRSRSACFHSSSANTRATPVPCGGVPF
jgi:CheY-like chemotaxis protein